MLNLWKLCEIVTLIFVFVSPQAGNYDESIRHLEFLQELNKDDFKISMNKAIVEFYKSGQTAIGNLKQSLMATIKSQVIGCRIPHVQSHSRAKLDLSVAFFFCLPFFSSSFPSFAGVHVNRRHWRAGRCWKQLIALQSSHYSLPHASVLGGHLHRREAVPVPGTVWYAFKSWRIYQLLWHTDFRNNPGVSSYERMVSCGSIEFEYDVMVCFVLFVFPTRREVCSGCLLSAGGSLPAHLPTWESSPPSRCTGQAVSTRKQQEQQRRGTTHSLRSV